MSVTIGTFPALSHTHSSLAVNALAPTYHQTVNGSTDNTAGLDAAFNAAATAGKPLYIPAGSWVYNGTGFSNSNVRIYGDPSGGTTVNLGATSSLVVSPTSGGSPTYITSLDVRNIRTVGGFGLITLTYTGANSFSNSYIVDNVRVDAFSGAAISSLATDHPYWKIKGFFHNYSTTANTGTAVALAGYTDCCDIDVDLQGVLIGVKLGRGGDSANIRGSWVSTTAYGGTARVPIWIVPETVTNNSGRGLNITQFRFGSENYNAADYRIVYADEDTASGATFATRYPKLGVASAGYIIGHTVTHCLVAGQGAGSTPTGPVVFSTTPNVRGCRYELVINGNVPNYGIQFLTAPAPDWASTTNVFRFILPDTSTVSSAPRVSNGFGVGTVVDDSGQLARFPEHVHAYPGGMDTTGLNTLISVTPASLAVGATKSAVTDAKGGSDAYEVTYTGTSDALYGSISSGVINVGQPTWVEFDIKAGSSSSLTDLEVRSRYTASTIHADWYIPVTASWVRHRRLYVPRANSSNHQLTFTVHNETAGKVQIGRVRMYQAREPINLDLVNPAPPATGQWTPANHNLIAWAFDPAIAANNLQITAGTLNIVGLQIPYATTITNLIVSVITAGATLTSGQNFVALFQGGNLLGTTADQSAAWVSTGVKTAAISGGPVAVTAGLAYVGMWFNGTTSPAFMRGTSVPATSVGLGSAYRYATANTGLTTTAPSTLGALTQLNSALWAAVS